MLDILYGNTTAQGKKHFENFAATHTNLTIRAKAQFIADNYDALAKADTDSDTTTLSKASILKVMELTGAKNQLTIEDINAIIL